MPWPDLRWMSSTPLRQRRSFVPSARNAKTSSGGRWISMLLVLRHRRRSQPAGLRTSPGRPPIATCRPAARVGPPRGRYPYLHAPRGRSVASPPESGRGRRRPISLREGRQSHAWPFCTRPFLRWDAFPPALHLLQGTLVGFITPGDHVIEVACLAPLSPHQRSSHGGRNHMGHPIVDMSSFSISASFSIASGGLATFLGGERGLGPRRFEQLDRVARRVFEQDLFAADPNHDLVSEPGLRPTEFAHDVGQIGRLEHEAVPAAGLGLVPSGID